MSKQCESALVSRGLNVDYDSSFNLDSVANSSAPASVGGIHTIVLETAPNTKQAAILGERVASIVEGGLPPILLIPMQLCSEGKAVDRSGDQQAASMALLRARGAIVLRAPDVWLECVVLLAGYGLPNGPQGAIVAHPSGWLARSAAELQKRAELVGERFSPLAHGHDEAHTTDFVLTDLESGESGAGALCIPLGVANVRRDGEMCLYGLSNALAAAEHAGQARQRIAAGDGPAVAKSEADLVRFERQMAKTGTSAGDHECKVLLSSYDVPITRQAVATTPSAATRIAKKAGYPVQIKAWGPNQPSEPEGALVHADVTTAADVRRAFSSICTSTACEAVVIRETPMSGREIRVDIRHMGAIGLVCFLYQRGRPEPVAALAPLRPIDARAMARHVVASRAGDLDPDWAALASLLINASHMVADTPRITAVELCRVVVGTVGQGALVVDARAHLRAV
ncbi:MAG: hypothetical protein GY811_10475 [Myxococcales bacterium]|nr:hypothetical protein [Myxococcales bacterium]